MTSRSDRRIAHLADLHFDVEHLDDALASFRFAGQAAIDRGCSALVLAGDIWDRGISVSEKSPLNPVADEICAVAEYMPVVILKGNHDPAGSLDILARLATHYPVIVASTPRVECINGIHFSLMPYPYKSWLLAQSTGSQDETDLIASDALRAIVRGFAATYASAGIDRPQHGRPFGRRRATHQVPRHLPAGRPGCAQGTLSPEAGACLLVHGPGSRSWRGLHPTAMAGNGSNCL